MENSTSCKLYNVTIKNEPIHTIFLQITQAHVLQYCCSPDSICVIIASSYAEQRDFGISTMWSFSYYYFHLFYSHTCLARIFYSFLYSFLVRIWAHLIYIRNKRWMKWCTQNDLKMGGWKNNTNTSELLTITTTTMKNHPSYQPSILLRQRQQYTVSLMKFCLVRACIRNCTIKM